MTNDTPTPLALQALPAGTTLQHADSDAALRACWPAMQQLRPRLADAGAFVARVQHMRQDGYRLLAAWRGEEAIALGGYRLQENLVYGRFLYVDDLVTHDSARGQGWGARLIVAMQDIAAQAGCAHFVLDTHIANTGAQRFYAQQGLANNAIRFSSPVAQKLTQEVAA